MPHLPISEQVKAARVGRGESLRQVATRAGIAYNTVSRVEEGGSIGSGNLEALAESLEMAVLLLPLTDPLVSLVANKLKATTEELC